MTNQIFCTTAYKKKEAKIKMKVTDIFKVIIFAFLVITFTVSAAACKEAPVVEEQVVEEQQQEEEKAEVIISSETKETPSVVEETPEKIEWEGVSFSPIEGLRFDKGDFYFMEGNEYGGIPGEKAGELITDANVEIDGKIENIFFGLRPEVIEVILKKIIEEKKEFKYPLPLFAKG
ncbi:MAG: hypothetical protein MUO85_10845, partial [candidate division Zixibacteria bacterium]|nr:hypothetical protein [candidate division Zixibacteria bacterium]